jgi:hypothetical protein
MSVLAARPLRHLLLFMDIAMILSIRNPRGIIVLVRTDEGITDITDAQVKTATKA